MHIFNTFTNRQHIKKLPDIDLLLWSASLASYQLLGYKLKLYCSKDDIEFLKENLLSDFYDEIDTDFFDNNEQLKLIDESKFWSTRKIEAVKNEIALGNKGIYSDVDIVMFERFDLTDKDAYVWSPEENHGEDNTIYVNWNKISSPLNYFMPEHIRDTNDAYNCGVMWFRTQELFDEYYNEYYKFAIDNPGTTTAPNEANNIFACNTEQRILKAVLTHNNARVGMVMPNKMVGISQKGNHYFWMRAMWRIVGKLPLDRRLEVLKKNKMEMSLNYIRDGCIYMLQQNGNHTLLNHFSQNPYLMQPNILEYK